MNEDLTIEEAAQLRGVSKDTIRRQIRKGILRANKSAGRYGEQWLIPKAQLNEEPMQIQTVTQGVQGVNIKELRQMVEQALTDTMRKVVREEVAVTLEKIEARQERQEQRMNEHYRVLDETLRARTQPKPRFSLFGLFQR